jgi:SAM-dependent methyltransferase
MHVTAGGSRVRESRPIAPTPPRGPAPEPEAPPDGARGAQTEQTNAHYTPLFSQLTLDLGPDALRLETECLAYELEQVPGIPRAGLVLDAGCGTGRYAAAWRTLFPAATVVGVDINRTILRTGQVQPGALAPINGNLEALPFGSGSFDVVMSRGAIQHTADPRQALRELLRVCRPGGILYFYTYCHGWYDIVLGALRRVASGLGTRACSRVIYYLARLLRLDPRVGPMILDELFVPIRFAFSEETILEWLYTSGVPLASVQPLVHAQFGSLCLPVDARTRWLYRLAPKNKLITFAVRTAPGP